MTASEDETAAIARETALGAKASDVFYLKGPLGAGKSVFARNFIRALCGDDTEVPSPTFTLVQTYEHTGGSIWHFDLYRLQDPEEIYETGWEEAIGSGAILLVEWLERLGTLAPPRARTVSIEPLGPTARRISIDE